MNFTGHMSIRSGYMAAPSNPAEYAICRRRGHHPSGHAISQSDITWQECRWCGGWYRFTEPRLVEWETEDERVVLDVDSGTVSGGSLFVNRAVGMILDDGTPELYETD